MSIGHPNKRYTPGFKINIIETMHKEKLSYKEATRQFDMNGQSRVASWECVYLEIGYHQFVCYK